MIRIIPTKIEAYDDENELVFTMVTVDSVSTELKLNADLCNGNVDEICDAIKTAVKIMELE